MTQADNAFAATVRNDWRVKPLGHSDGGSIALLHAARFPDSVAGAFVAAPHIFVENLSVSSGIARRDRPETLIAAGRYIRRHEEQEDKIGASRQAG